MACLPSRCRHRRVPYDMVHVAGAVVAGRVRIAVGLHAGRPYLCCLLLLEVIASGSRFGAVGHGFLAAEPASGCWRLGARTPERAQGLPPLVRSQGVVRMARAAPTRPDDASRATISNPFTPCGIGGLNNERRKRERDCRSRRVHRSIRFRETHLITLHVPPRAYHQACCRWPDVFRAAGTGAAASPRYKMPRCVRFIESWYGPTDSPNRAPRLVLRALSPLRRLGRGPYRGPCGRSWGRCCQVGASGRAVQIGLAEQRARFHSRFIVPADYRTKELRIAANRG